MPEVSTVFRGEFATRGIERGDDQVPSLFFKSITLEPGVPGSPKLAALTIQPLSIRYKQALLILSSAAHQLFRPDNVVQLMV